MDKTSKIKKGQDKLKCENTILKKRIKELNTFISKLNQEKTGKISHRGFNLEKSANDICDYYENILALMPGHVYWLDKNNVYLGCNDLHAKSAGLSSPKEIVGKTNYDLIWKDIAAELNTTNNEVMKTGKSYAVVEIGLMSSNEERTFLTQKKPLYDKHGNTVGILGVSLDITEHKKAETKALQLEKEKTAIETKRQIISDLASSIAHEIGNLLAGTHINMQLLGYDLKPKTIGLIEKREDADGNKKILELFDNLERSMKNANFMFESIKMNIRQGSINKSQFELVDITEDIEAVLSSCFPDEKDVANIKWNKKQGFEYVGIPSYTRNILINLIKNSLYFIKEEKQGEISIMLKKGKKFNQLIFEDTAKGIPTKLLPKLFTRFSTTRKGGTGMGLAFCKMVMQEYGGGIVCESELGKYTRFILTFPAAIVE